jgi:hypothetical protein
MVTVRVFFSVLRGVQLETSSWAQETVRDFFRVLRVIGMKTKWAQGDC